MDEIRSSGEDGGPLAPSRDESGGLVVLRDAQTLQRAFRHLAEVQESLLDRIEAVEEERRRRQRLFLPLALGGAALMATAVGVLAWTVASQPGPEELQAALEAGQARITVAPTPVTIEAPENAVDAATVEALIQQLEAARVRDEDSRRLVAELGQRLIDREMESMETLRELGALGAQGRARTSPPTGGTASPEAEANAMPAAASSALPRDPWLGALNGLLAVSGFSRFQFDRGTRRPGSPVVEDVLLLEWDQDGRIDSVVQAEQARFSLHQMSGLLVVELSQGSRSRGGVRAPLPEDGLRLEFAQVDPSPWLEHFPELGAPDATDPVELERLRGILDGLLAQPRAVGYYRLASLGGLQGKTLKLVQLQRFDGAGRLVRTLEADSMSVRLHPSGEVELLLQNGAIHEGGVRRPFYEDRFRVFLPRQPLQEWHDSGVPLTELAS